MLDKIYDTEKRKIVRWKRRDDLKEDEFRLFLQII